MKYNFPKIYFLVGTLIFSAIQIHAQTRTLKYNTYVSTNCNGYYEYLPASYATQPEKKYPLFIYLHGIGTIGNGEPGQLENIVNLGTNTPPYRSWRGWLPNQFTINTQTFEYILITPQYIEEPYTYKTDVRDVNDVLNYCLSHYRVDMKRIYLTGQSGGAASVMIYASSNIENATKFAAIAVSSPAKEATQDQGNVISQARLPVWIAVSEFDNSKDDYSFYRNYAQSWATTITNATPAPVVAPLLSILPGTWTHNHAAVWLFDPAPIVNDPEYYPFPQGINVYQWLLQFQRESPLPVTISEFNAQANGNLISLSWTTQSEFNNKGFNVQESTDGLHFENVGFIQAKGKGSTYHFHFNTQHNGVLYFRIQQTDLDGRTSFSNIASVRMAASATLVVAPNPVKNILKLQFNTTFNNATIQLFDNNGRLQKEVKTNHESQKQIDVSNLSKGFYTGRVISDKKSLSFTFIKD